MNRCDHPVAYFADGEVLWCAMCGAYKDASGWVSPGPEHAAASAEFDIRTWAEKEADRGVEADRSDGKD